MVTRKSAILGPDGRPIEVAALSEEIAGPSLSGVRRTHSDHEATGLTPERLASILRQAAAGHARSYLTLAEEMEERYLHYASQLQTRRLAIESVDMTIEGKGVPSKIIDAVSELVEDPSLPEAAGSLSDGIAKGLATVEMIWEYERKALRPVDYIYRDPRFFQFDELSLTDLRLAVDGSRDGQELPQAKFLRHLPRAKMGIPYRRGVARPAAWAFLIQSYALQDWAAFAEVYGMPLRVGRYHGGASESDKRTLLRAVTSIANDASAIIPKGMDIEFHEVSGQRGEAVFGGLLEYVDKQISKLVVGQTMTSDDGSSLGQAKIHNEVRLDILRADCRQLALTITRDLIRPFVDLNFGPQDVYPHLAMPVPDPEDVEVLSNSLERLVPLGLKVSQGEIRDKLGLSQPGDDDELLAAPRTAEPAAPDPATQKVPKPVKPPENDNRSDNRARAQAKTQALAAIVADHKRACRCGACAALLSAEAATTGTSPAAGIDALTELDAVFDGAMDDWEAVAAPIVAPIAAIIANATSFEDALAMLEAAGPDASAMAEKLMRLTAIARGIGDVAD